MGVVRVSYFHFISIFHLLRSSAFPSIPSSPQLSWFSSLKQKVAQPSTYYTRGTFTVTGTSFKGEITLVDRSRIFTESHLHSAYNKLLYYYLGKTVRSLFCEFLLRSTSVRHSRCELFQFSHLRIAICLYSASLTLIGSKTASASLSLSQQSSGQHSTDT